MQCLCVTHAAVQAQIVPRLISAMLRPPILKTAFHPQPTSTHAVLLQGYARLDQAPDRRSSVKA